MPTERAIVRAVLAYLRSLPGAEFRKRPPVYVVGHKGDPDITGCIRNNDGLGIHIELEVKQPGGKPTKLQQAMLERWRKAGAIALVVCSVEEVKQVLEALVIPGNRSCV